MKWKQLRKTSNFTRTRAPDALMYYKGGYLIVLNLHANLPLKLIVARDYCI
jgi:hypothetical protein